MKKQIIATRVLVWCAGAIALLGFGLTWSLGDLRPFGFGMHLRPTGLEYGQVAGWELRYQALGALVGLPSLLAQIWGLWRLDAMLARFSSVSMFALESIADLRVFAGATLLSTLLSIAESPLRKLLFCVVPGAPVLANRLDISTEQLLLMLVCLVFFVVTHLMHAARALAQENEEFV